MGIAYSSIFRDKSGSMVGYVRVFGVCQGMKAGRSTKGRAGRYCNGKGARGVYVRSGGWLGATNVVVGIIGIVIVIGVVVII